MFDIYKFEIQQNSARWTTIKNIMLWSTLEIKLNIYDHL